MTTLMNPMHKPKEGITEWGNEKVCLYSSKFIKNVREYFTSLPSYNPSNIQKSPIIFPIDGLMVCQFLVMSIEINDNVHEIMSKYDNSHVNPSNVGDALYKITTKYESITDKFNDWKRITNRVDKLIDQIIEFIGQDTKYKNSKNFMEGPASKFKMLDHIEKMKKTYCITSTRGELNMTLKSEQTADLGLRLGGKRTRRSRNRNRKQKNRKSKSRRR